MQPVEVPLPQILVSDTRQALGRLAARWRAGFHGPLIALTGSNGKTTVKEMLRAILAEGGATLATEGNLNNEIGVPLTLLRLASAQRWAVVEMGANHAGEIARLTRLTNPTVGLLTNAAAAHLEGFGSLEGVARAKGELFENLAPGATAVVNADDRWASMWLASCGKRPVLRFALDADAEFTATDVRESGTPLSPALEFRLVTPLGESDARVPMLGSHNVANALAAAAAAIAAGASLGQVRRGLAAVANVAGRLTAQPGLEGCTVYDDSYNANPASVAAAIDFLASRSGTRVLVLGDLGELGADAAALHREAGQRARDAGLDLLIGVGPLSRNAVEAFGPGAVAVDDVDGAEQALRRWLAPQVSVLVKGSRAAALERLVSRLVASPERTGT